MQSVRVVFLFVLSAVYCSGYVLAQQDQPNAAVPKATGINDAPTQAERQVITTAGSMPCGGAVEVAAMKAIPTHVQAGGTCWEYTASEMVDAYRVSHPPVVGGFDEHGMLKHVTSPWAAYIGELSLTKGSGSGGKIGIAVSALRVNNSCDHHAVIGDKGKLSGAALTKYMNNLKQAWESYRAIMGDAKKVEALTEDEKVEKGKQAIARVQCVMHANGLPDNLIPPDDILLKAIKSDKIITYHQSILDYQCRGENTVPVDIPKTQSTFFQEDPNRVRNQIVAALNRPNPQPVGIGFCSGVLFKENYEGVTTRSANYKERKYDKGCGLHAVLVTGKRTGADGACQFKIRNSWGAGCPYKRKGIQCDPSTGDIWISAEEISNNVENTEIVP